MNRISFEDYEKLYCCAVELQLFIQKQPKTGSPSYGCMSRLRDEFEASTTYSCCEQIINEASPIIESYRQSRADLVIYPLIEGLCGSNKARMGQ